MDKAHEKTWTNTKEYYEILLKHVTNSEEEGWFRRRVKSCQDLLDTC